ncbi:hypothetical protein GDO81_014712 [Engystomops pustulosus]|uniref:Ig-like domain-containing protein n=1 Tax=Engystomops pustulosus TaxID=76066 RepID=A0AAV7BC71_ENGPU|nr:hypothetical protein GDO81_014712 [Engystomops pustulosus]KAG8570112.1 hypothetical protein GDO81_014712 [Engystomops pustulosus]
MGVSLVVILPLFWIGVTCQVPGYSINVASSVSVQEGLCVSIPCTFTAEGVSTFTNAIGLWIRTDTNPWHIVASNDESRPGEKPNFHLTGNPDTGNCSLTITDARRGDEETYYFRYENRKDSTKSYSYTSAKHNKPRITVTDLTEEPVISDLGTVIAGVEKTVTCSPPGNCPATSLTFQWRKSNVPDIWRENSPAITFTPSLDDNGTTITCEMTNSKGTTTQRTIRLNVYSPPNITITWEINGKQNNKPDPIRVDEGSSMILKCSVQSDLEVNVTWTDGKNKVLQHGSGKELKLQLYNITTNQTGVYTCSAMNEHLTRSTNISVTVQYLFIIVNISITSSKGGVLPVSQQVPIDPAETLTLACRVDGYPTVRVVWIKGEFRTNISTVSNSGASAMVNVTSSMADVYRCLAWNEIGFKEQWIRVGTKQESTAQPVTDSVSLRDIAIGLMCGLSVSVLIIILYTLITRKKLSMNKKYVKAEEPPANVEPSKDVIYVNINASHSKPQVQRVMGRSM